MNKNILIIDYGMGNTFSIQRVINKIQGPSIITKNPDNILSADYVILPGVGAFDKAMKSLKQNNLHEAIIERVKKERPIIGICLGMQLLCESSEEGNLEGLGIMQGNIIKFPKKNNYPIPQIQWNIASTEKNSVLLGEKNERNYYYFLHSYYRKLEDCSSEETVITAKYCGIEYCAGFEKGMIFGTQFHPELSGISGEKLMRRFFEIGE